MTLATEAGPTDIPLLDETIGANLARTVAAHGSREALVARHQGVRWTYDELAERVADLRQGADRPRAGGRRPGRAVEPELRRVGAAAVRHGRDRRDPRQRQPGVPHPRAAVRARPVGLPDAVRGAVVQDVRLRRDGRAGRARAARAGALDLLLGRRLGRAGRRRRARRRDGDLAARARRAAPGDAINIQYTSGTTGLPEGRHAEPPQHPQQRLLRGPPAGLPAGRPAVRPRARCTTASAW